MVYLKFCPHHPKIVLPDKMATCRVCAEEFFKVHHDFLFGVPVSSTIDQDEDIIIEITDLDIIQEG